MRRQSLAEGGASYPPIGGSGRHAASYSESCRADAEKKTGDKALSG